MALVAGGMALNAVAVEAASSHKLNSAAIEFLIGTDEPDPRTVRVSATTLSASDALKQALIEEEGIRYSVYTDVAGNPTIGVGHLVLPEDNLSVDEHVSHDRVMGFLTKDLKAAEAGVLTMLGDLKVYQHEFDALVDLVFNVGIGGVSEHRSPKLNAAIDAGDYTAIAAELDYTSAGNAVAGGLVLRSERRSAIFQGGDYENIRNA